MRATSIQGGLDADKSASPVAEDVYLARDTGILYVCFVSGTWTNIGILYLLLAGGTMSGAIAMGTNKITGMGDPTLAHDAATRAYVLAQTALYIRFKTGSYTGNGVDNRAITGVGFLPKLVILQKITDPPTFTIHSEQDSGDISAKLIGGTTDFSRGTNHIQSLDADGFTIGTNVAVNQDTIAYHYYAWG